MKCKQFKSVPILYLLVSLLLPSNEMSPQMSVTSCTHKQVTAAGPGSCVLRLTDEQTGFAVPALDLSL